MLDQRQGEPFAEHRQVAGAEYLQRHVGHRLDVAAISTGSSLVPER